jgi:hypothetical protein
MAVERTRGPLRAIAVDKPRPPEWVQALFQDAKTEPIAEGGDSARIDLARADEFALFELLIPNAKALDAADLHDALKCAYRRLLTEVRVRGLSPLRFWNYLPEIERRRDRGASTYEIFNSARLAAYRDEYADADLSTRVAAASAVGMPGEDVRVHAFAAERPGRAIANPRQIQPHHYSRAYGAVPPAFARGIVLDPQPSACEGCPDAIISGTASIVGERTRHRNDLAAQLAEIARNLAALLEALDTGSPSEKPSPSPDGPARLAQLSEARAYIPDPRSEAAILAWCEASFPQLEGIELVTADLCRPDLMVEIEAIVSFAAPSIPHPGASTTSP